MLAARVLNILLNTCMDPCRQGYSATFLVLKVEPVMTNFVGIEQKRIQKKQI